MKLNCTMNLANVFLDMLVLFISNDVYLALLFSLNTFSNILMNIFIQLFILYTENYEIKNNYQ